MTTSDKIRELIEENGLTQRQFAELVNIHYITLGNNLKNDNFSHKSLEKIANAFSISVYDLISDTETWINQRLDDINGLVSEAIQATNNNADTIGSVITETAETIGYNLSEYANMLWSGDNDNTTLLLKAYEDVSRADAEAYVG